MNGHHHKITEPVSLLERRLFKLLGWRLVPAHARILRALADGEACSAAQIARYVEQHGGGMSKGQQHTRMNDLVNLGLVAVKKNPHANNKLREVRVWLVLTPAGRKLIEEPVKP